MQHSSNDNALIYNASSLYARPKSKWDDLIDEDDEDDDASTKESIHANDRNMPSDMTYIESNIRRQADTYDQLESIGGQDAINDIYARTPGGRQWWLVGKIARISGEYIIALSFRSIIVSLFVFHGLLFIDIKFYCSKIVKKYTIQISK